MYIPLFPIQTKSPVPSRRAPNTVINPGPYSKHRGFPQQDRVEPKEWRTVFDDYEDSSTKVGYPYVGLFGKARPVYGKCPWCGSPLCFVEEQGVLVCPGCNRKTPVRSEMRTVESPNLTQAPQQRRQLAISDPKDQKLQPNPNKSGIGKEFAMYRQPDADLSFNIRDYPGQVSRDY